MYILKTIRNKKKSKMAFLFKFWMFLKYLDKRAFRLKKISIIVLNWTGVYPAFVMR